MAGLYDLAAHRRGDTWNGLTAQVIEGDSVDDTPMDLTGATIKMQVKTEAGSVARLTFSTGSGIEITDAADGRFQVNAAVVDLPAKSYVYDVQITKASGYVVTVLSGSWEIVNDTTR